MSEDASIDDLFNDAEPKETKPKATRKPRAAKPKIVVEKMTDDELAGIVANEHRKGIRSAAEAEIARRSNPESAATAPGHTEMIDNAVRIRRLDWECECGNTNTHDLQRCGKCRNPRYTN